MKKLTSLTAATFVALALVGCSQDGVVNEAPTANQAIEFGTYLGRDAQGQTRATATDLAYVQLNGFGVFAYYTKQTLFENYDKKTTPNFMYNEEVDDTDKNNTWTYDPVKYWPNNENDLVSFIAYAPYDANAEPSTNSFVISYTVPTDATKTTQGTVAGGQGQDLLYAKVLNRTKQALNEKVKFEFKHTLSRIGFSVQGAIDMTGTSSDLSNAENNKLDDNTTITVNKVILSGKEHTYANSTVKEPTEIEGAPVFYKSANLDLLTGDWDGGSTDKLYFILTTENFVDTNSGATGTQFELKGAQNEAKKLNKDDSYLMIIPQDFKNSATDKLYVYIEYTVTTTDSGNANNSSTITNYISTEAPINFEAGKAYNIKLILGLNSVDIEASDTGWGADTGEDVNLPGNNGGTPGTTTDPNDPAPDTSDPDSPSTETPETPAA